MKTKNNPYINISQDTLKINEYIENLRKIKKIKIFAIEQRSYLTDEYYISAYIQADNIDEALEKYIIIYDANSNDFNLKEELKYYNEQILNKKMKIYAIDYN